MSDLDKAIRADIRERSRDVEPYAADRSMVTYADAIRSVLDLHTHSDVDGVRITTGPMRQCAACGLVSRGSWCDTVNAIADDLGVSGEDRSEPTPEPAEWVFGFAPQGAESAWRCQRCREVMPKNQRACPACAYTVFDPVHREVVSPEGTP